MRVLCGGVGGRAGQVSKRGEAEQRDARSRGEEKGKSRGPRSGQRTGDSEVKVLYIRGSPRRGRASCNGALGGKKKASSSNAYKTVRLVPNIHTPPSNATVTAGRPPYGHTVPITTGGDRWCGAIPSRMDYICAHSTAQTIGCSLLLLSFPYCCGCPIRRWPFGPLATGCPRPSFLLVLRHQSSSTLSLLGTFASRNPGHKPQASCISPSGQQVEIRGFVIAQARHLLFPLLEFSHP